VTKSVVAEQDQAKSHLMTMYDTLDDSVGESTVICAKAKVKLK